MGVEMWKSSISTPSLTLSVVRGCCRFSGFTTTAYPLRVQGGGDFPFLFPHFGKKREILVVLSPRCAFSFVAGTNLVIAIRY
jgi:hypothetical protein